MRPMPGYGSGALLLVVGLWRGASELLSRYRDLRASGELARRVEARRHAMLDRAIALARVRERAYSPPVLVPAFGAVHASVQVGTDPGNGDDVDDVGLLEGAMRRAAQERMDVSSTGVRRTAAKRVRRAAARGQRHLAVDVLANAPAAAPPPAPRTERPRRADGGWTDWEWLAGASDRRRPLTWQLPAVLGGGLLTLVPLVRPLHEASPWLAIAGIALVLAGWAGARRE